MRSVIFEASGVFDFVRVARYPWERMWESRGFVRRLCVAFVFAFFFSHSVVRAEPPDSCSQGLRVGPFTVKLRVVQKEDGSYRPLLFSHKDGSIHWIDWLLDSVYSKIGLDRFAEYVYKARQDPRPNVSFFSKIVEASGLEVRFNKEILEKIPETGPVVFVANHSFGGIDVLAIVSLIEKKRPDFKVIANEALKILSEVADHTIFVKKPFFPWQKKSIQAANKSAIEEMNAYVQHGGSVMLFPSGGLAKTIRPDDPFYIQIPWKKGFLKMAQSTAGSKIVPIFFHEQLSARTNYYRSKRPLKSILGSIHEINTALDRPAQVTLGAPIDVDSLRSLTDETAVNYVRAMQIRLGCQDIQDQIRGGELIYTTTPVLRDEEVQALVQVHGVSKAKEFLADCEGLYPALP